MWRGFELYIILLPYILCMHAKPSTFQTVTHPDTKYIKQLVMPVCTLSAQTKNNLAKVICIYK